MQGPLLNTGKQGGEADAERDAGSCVLDNMTARSPPMIEERPGTLAGLGSIF